MGNTAANFDAGAYITENCEELRRIIAGMTTLFNLSATVFVEKEDLLQEGFLAIWRKKDKFDPEHGADFEHWASTVVYNRFMDIIRHDAYRKKLETRIQDISERLEDLPPDLRSSNSMTMPEVQEDFFNALGMAFANERSRTVRIGLIGVWNAFTGQYTIEELSKKLNVDRVLLNSCISRARKRLQPYLKDYYAG